MKETLKKQWEKENLANLIISGRQEPTIYAFSTQTVPNYLKIGDTYRLLSMRLDEWKKYYKNLKKEFSESALVSNNTYFRDFAVHSYLKNDLKKHQLQKGELSIPYYSKEFFENTSPEDIESAIEDIKEKYHKNVNKYQYYNAENRLPKTYQYKRNTKLILRDEQNQVIERFKTALKNNRTNLLLYAVMRFGKSVVALRCAQEMKAKTVLIVSAKADVGEEWQRTVQSIIGFEKFVFLNAKDLLSDKNKIKSTIKKGKTATIFLTLQDLNGKQIKEKHKELFNSKIDLIIIDETHFGAWAKSYGEVLRNTKQIKEPKDKREGVSNEKEFDEAQEIVKSLKAKIKLHLSGTPYRILLEKQFTDEDIIGYYQLSDIEKAKKKWDEEHFTDIENSVVNGNTGKPYQEWDNPYFGFPQMVRFAFNPNESARKKLTELKKSNSSANLSDLFMPESIKKDSVNKNHTKFQNEKEVLDLMKAIDGSKEDKNILSFLNDERIKEGKMCRHMVFVLPYRASCDALETLIETHKKDFLNLNGYKIINISGVDNDKQYKTIESVKNEIQKCEDNDQKTITLTVNRMLTGVTVEEWDSMVFLKSLSSPQEYDQAIFRIQNQYVRKYPAKDNNNDFIKRDMKPQTLLVDFEPSRMFRIQENKSQIYNWYDEKNGNAKLKERLKNDLSISPIIYFNIDKIQRVTATDLMKYISDYSSDTSVIDELKTLNIDMEIYNVPEIKEIIDAQSPIGSKQGLLLEKKAHEGKETDLDVEESEQKETRKESAKPDKYESLTPEEKENLIKLKIEAYYFKILFYAFLTKNSVSNINDIIETINKSANKLLSKNIGIDKPTLVLLQKKMSPPLLSQLDYRIQNINELSNDNTKTPIERMQNALNKFNRLSNSEIITPYDICEQMVDSLGKEIKQGPILDIASKAGEFALATYRALKKLGIKESAIKNRIYSIPTSPIAYEFTRKMYEAIGLNTNNIAKKFTAYDIIKEKPENAKRILCQNQKFSEIAFDIKKIKKGGKQVIFSAIVGNPPYQDEAVGDNRTFLPQIYWKFLDYSYAISDRTIMIHPAKFLFDAGKTPKKWNKKMLNNTHLEVLLYEPDSNKIFKNTDVKGGIAITRHDNTITNEPIIIFTPYNELNNILHKVLKAKDYSSLSKIVVSRTAYRLSKKLHQDYPEAISQLSKGHAYDMSTNIFERLPQVFYDEKPNDNKEYARILGRLDKKRTFKYIKREYINDVKNYSKYKVCIAKANGDGALGNIGTPIICEPNTGSTESFLSVGCFGTRAEAEACEKYLKTKFFRTMLGVLKVTQDITPEKFKYVPLQNFFPNSDIAWSKTVSEIDEQLYEKYKLNKEEINFINNKVKKME